MMKKLSVVLLVFLASLPAISQDCSMVIFNQSGERFQVILNGVLQNINYETNIKITDLYFEGNYKVTIAFENPQIPELDKSIFLMDRNSEYTYNIKQNKKGQYVMRSTGVVPLNQNRPPVPNQTIIVYSTTPPVAVSSTTTTHSSSTTTTHVGHGTQDNVAVSVGMNIGDANVNMNVNINDGINTGSTTTHSSTTTSTTVQSSAVAVSDHYVMPGYNGPIGCPYPMSDSDFAAAKTSISSKSFSDSRLAIAKQITNTNCLTSNQAKQIIELFDFEDARLAYAKYAYGYTFDLGNYFLVNDAFEFESTIDELNDFIESF
jgi:hypothetical protein